MKNQCVAILDIRSNEVCFMLGSREVNGTFGFTGTASELYEGYSVEEGFHDVDSFRRAVEMVITSVRQNYEGNLDEIFVGVPSCFLSIQTKGQTNSYPRKRKITAQDIERLFESGLDELMTNGHCVRYSEMYFSLGDNRRYFAQEDIYGISTTMLKGGLSYYFIQDEFYDDLDGLLRGTGFHHIHFIPSTLAQANYLLSRQNREGYKFLLDIGFLTSSISVVYGNGIVHEETFDCGVGEILVLLAKRFEVEYWMSEEILLMSNISGGRVSAEEKWRSEQEDLSLSVQEINDTIKCGLDLLCENVERFFYKYYGERNTVGFSTSPIYLTGEGVAWIKGIAEHISGRLNRWTEVVFPDLPYYNKPMYASRISLLDVALKDKEAQSWFYKIFNKFGGKRK